MSSAPHLAADLRLALGPIALRLRRGHTLSLGKSGILNRLADHGPATASELAAAERITPQAVAMALKELEGLSYVTRVRDDADRRKIHVAITEQGRVVLRSDREDGTRWLTDAVDTRLDDADRAVLASAVTVLRKLVDDADDE